MKLSQARKRCNRMEFRINGKPFDDWSLEEMQVLINESEIYRENGQIDYKKNFSFLEIQDKSIRNEKKKEFCNDICSFANSETGYLFFGIEEKNGEPTRLCGVNITNGDTDKFELDRRNEIAWIQPTVPLVRFKFISIEENQYIVILMIEKGLYAPYVCHKIDEAYAFYIRNGNKKRIMEYREIERMFKYSNSLTKAIKDFVDERIEELRYYNLQNTRIESKGIAVLHIIPDDFQSNTDISKMYRKVKKENIRFQSIFNSFCYGKAMPFVDGLQFNNVGCDNGIRVRIYNNGIAELSMELNKYVWPFSSDKQRINIHDITEKFAQFSHNYIDEINVFTNSKRIYLCASIIDANDMVTETNEWHDYYNYISDAYNVCSPIEVFDASESADVSRAINDMITVVCLACGIERIEEYLENIE